MQLDPCGRHDPREAALIAALRSEARFRAATVALIEALDAPHQWASLGHLVHPDVLGSSRFDALMLELLTRHPQHAGKLPAVGVNINLFGRDGHNCILAALVARCNLVHAADAHTLCSMARAAVAAGAHAAGCVTIDARLKLQTVLARFAERLAALVIDESCDPSSAILATLQALLDAGVPVVPNTSAPAAWILADALMNARAVAAEHVDSQSDELAWRAASAARRGALCDLALQAILARQTPAEHATLTRYALGKVVSNPYGHAAQAAAHLARWQLEHGHSGSVQDALANFRSQRPSHRAARPIEAMLAASRLRAASAQGLDARGPPDVRPAASDGAIL